MRVLIIVLFLVFGFKLQSSEAGELRLSGSFRTRYETLEGQFRAGGSGGDQLFSFLTLLRLEADVGPVDFLIEGVDSRQATADSGTPLSNAIVDTADLLQANMVYVNGPASLRAGRMTLDIGSRRLVARNRMRNTINAFSGIDGEWQLNEHTRLEALYAFPVFRRPSDRTSLEDNRVAWDREYAAVRFWGLFAEQRELWKAISLELYIFGLEEDDTGDLATRNRHLYTPGFRLYQKPGPASFDFSLEAAYQWGTARATSSASDLRDLEVESGFFHLDLGYTFSRDWSPRVGLEYDYASGDRDPGDQKYNRFDRLFGVSRAEFGPTGIYGAFSRANIHSPGWRLTFSPSPDLDFLMVHRVLWLASDRDAWTNARVVDPSGQTKGYLGQQVEFRLRWRRFEGRLVYELGGAHLAAGDFVHDAPGTTGEGDVTYGYIQATLKL